MKIKRLKLINWRNYYDEQAYWDDSVNIIYGANAQGKTNLLEAISYLSLASSFRAATEAELINRDKQYFFLEADICSMIQGKLTISAAMDRSKKRKWVINNQPRQRLVDIVGIFHTVVFSPEDIYLVKGGPEMRRRWLNRQISQLDPEYCRMLLTYNHILRQRNACLRREYRGAEEETLAIWDRQLIEYGSKISLRRRHIVAELLSLAGKLHEELSGGENLQLRYQSAVAGKEEFTDLSEFEELFKMELVRHAQTERIRGNTLVGPHRDDIKIFINNSDAREFASQGQQRTLAVSLKLAEVELAFTKKREYPVLLLDDVLSELDEKRQKRILELPEKTKTFISATGKDIQISRGKKWLVQTVDEVARIKT